MRTRKRFGQHFLEDVWVRKVIAAVSPQPDDVILEIGPGAGALTLPLARSARLVIGVELDRDLAADLTALAPPNVRVVPGDILDVNLAGMVPRRGLTHSRRGQPSLQHLVADPLQAAGRAGRGSADHRRDPDAAEGGGRPAGGLPGHARLRRADGAPGTPRADDAPAHAPAWGLPAAAEGHVRGGPARLPRGGGRHPCPAHLRRDRPRAVHATPENARQLPRGLRGRAGRDGGGMAATESASIRGGVRRR